MAISEVAIGNLALSHIGANSTMENFTIEETAEAKQVKLWYTFSRQQLLAAYDWSFARKRQALALASDPAPELEWLFAYQYPSDCIAARHIVNPFGKKADAIPFEVELDPSVNTKIILTDMEEACLAYTSDITTTSLFSEFFVETLSHLLASHIAFSLTGKRSIKGDEISIYNTLIRIAPAHDANERVGNQPRDAEWIRVRDS